MLTLETYLLQVDHQIHQFQEQIQLRFTDDITHVFTANIQPCHAGCIAILIKLLAQAHFKGTLEEEGFQKCDNVARGRTTVQTESDVVQIDALANEQILGGEF